MYVRDFRDETFVIQLHRAQGSLTSPLLLELSSLLPLTWEDTFNT